MYRTHVIILFVVMCAATALAQAPDGDSSTAVVKDQNTSGASSARRSPSSSHNWSGFYLGGNVFRTHDNVNADDATLQINQISNLFVTGRGLVVVPGTTRPAAPDG